MFTFYCIANTAAKTKTNESLQISVPKKSKVVGSRIKCCSKRLGSSNNFAAVIFWNRF